MMHFGPLLTAMVTPFDQEGKVNFKMIPPLVDHLINTGSDGLVVHGTTGESPTLSHDEEYELYRVVKTAARGRAKLIAGTGSNATTTAVRSTCEAERIGVDAAMIVVPYYNKPSQEGLYQHFKAVAEATRLPLIIYNVPGRTVANILPDTVARLAALPNYVAIKEASGSLEQVSQVRRLTPPDFFIYSGDDALTLPMLAVGAGGVISVASHIVGRDLKEMMRLFMQGAHQEAALIHRKLLPLFNALFMTANPVPVKAALCQMGIDVGGPRLPLVDLTSSELARLKEVLEPFIHERVGSVVI